MLDLETLEGQAGKADRLMRRKTIHDNEDDRLASRVHAQSRWRIHLLHTTHVLDRNSPYEIILGIHLYSLSDYSRPYLRDCELLRPVQFSSTL